MASKKGTPLEIATQGFSSPEALGISTQGFIEPVLGDIITGGEAGVVYVIGFIASGGLVSGGDGFWNITQTYLGSGGLQTIGGAGGVSRAWSITGAGGLTLGGAAGISTTIVPTVGGDIVTGGAGGVSRTIVYSASGGLVTGGAGNVNITLTATGDGGLGTGGTGGGSSNLDVEYTGSGGVVLGGSADAIFNLGITISRGGVFYRNRPGIRFEYAPPHKELTPKEYWKKIEDAIEKAKQREAKLFKHEASGGLVSNITGKSKIAVVICDLPDSKVIVHSNFEVDDKVKLEISRLFNNDLTADELRTLDDEFVLNNLLNRGDYEIKTGDKSRFRYRGKAGGEAGVSFQPAGAKVDHFDRKEDQVRKEDEELLLGPENRKLSREEEELELLGLLD